MTTIIIALAATLFVALGVAVWLWLDLRDAERLIIVQRDTLANQQDRIYALAAEVTERGHIIDRLHKLTHRRAFVYMLCEQPVMDGPRILARKGSISAN